MSLRDILRTNGGATKSPSKTSSTSYKEGSLRHSLHDPVGYKKFQEKKAIPQKATAKTVAPTKSKYSDAIKQTDKNLKDISRMDNKSVIDTIVHPTSSPLYVGKTPYDPILKPGGIPVGQNLLQPYEEDSLIKKIGKGIVNYGGGTALRIASSIDQPLKIVAANANNLIKGRPQDWGEKDFTNDILEPSFPGAKNHPIISGLVETVLSPSTYFGGGIADDLAKTGKFGSGAIKGTAKNLEITNNLGKNAMKKSVKPSTISNAIEAPTSQNKLSNVSHESILPNAKEIPSNVTQPLIADKGKGILPIKSKEGIIPKETLHKRLTDLTTQKTDWEKKLGLYSKNSKDPKIINNIKALQKRISFADEEIKRINLQLFSGEEKLNMGQSKFQTNTIARSTTIPDEVKDMIKPGEFDFIKETSEEWQNQAMRNIQTDKQKVMRNIYESPSISGGTQAHEAAIIAHELLQEAEQTGSYAKFKSFLKTIAEKTRETARALKGTDTAWEKKTADGVIMDGQRIVDGIEEHVKKANPNKIKKIDKQTKDVTDALDNAKKQAGKQVEDELTPEQMLANKIGGTLSTKTKKPNPVMDMVNELFKSAKESPLPDNVARAKRNPVEYLKQAIQNKGNYADVWEKAKGIVKAKFANDDEAMQILDDYFDKGIIPTYSESTLNSSVQSSMRGLGQKLEDIAKSSKGDKQQALKDLTEHLTVTTGATADDATLLAQKIQKRFDEIVKDKSRQLLKNMLKEVPKKGQKSVYEKVMEIINLGGYDDSAIRDMIKQKEGLPILDDSDIKKIAEFMGKSKKFAEGSYDQTEWIKKAQQIISDKVPASGYEKFRGLQRISLILNPKSLITRNPLGNVILGTAENIKDVPGAMIDMVVSLGTGERTTALNPIKKIKGQIQGGIQGLEEYGKDIKRGVDTSPTRGQLELPPGRTFNNKILNAIDQFERKALQLGDRPFYQSAYNGRIEELKGLGRTIDDTAHAEAKLYALDRVFQNNSVLSKKAKELKSALGIIGDIVMPFTQTPANIMDKLIDYTPGGFIKAITQLGTISKGTFNQKLFVDRIGRSLTGTGIGILGYAMAQKGIITGKRNDDTDVANFEQGLGKSPYAVKIGDNYYTFDWAQPIAGLLAAGADAYLAGKDKKDAISALGAGTTAVGNTLINQSLFQGVVSLMSGYSPVAGLTKTALNAPLQAAPTVTSNIAKQIDPFVRETYDPNPLKQVANKFIAKIPFASKTLPKKVNQFGEEVKQQQGAGPVKKALNLFLNPSITTSFNPNDTQKEIQRLYTEGGTKTQFPTVVDKYIEETKDHPRINLTADEFAQYQKRTGELTMIEFEKEMKTESYKNKKADKDETADEKRAKRLSNLISDSKAKAKKEILKQRGYK